jgi:archaellum component FlaC
MADTDERIIRIEDKIDKVVEHIGSIDSTLAAQHVSLKEHMRRTELLEQEIEPIKAHVDMVSGAVKLILFTAAICGGIEGIISLLTYLRK